MDDNLWAISYGVKMSDNSHVVNIPKFRDKLFSGIFEPGTSPRKKFSDIFNPLLDISTMKLPYRSLIANVYLNCIQYCKCVYMTETRLTN